MIFDLKSEIELYRLKAVLVCRRYSWPYMKRSYGKLNFGRLSLLSALMTHLNGHTRTAVNRKAKRKRKRRRTYRRTRLNAKDFFSSCLVLKIGNL